MFQPGEVFQFDWNEDWANISGERVKLQVANIKLSHSQAFLVPAYPLQTHEMLFDAHWHALRGLAASSDAAIYDNMKTAFDRVGKGKQCDINARVKAMASHCVFEPEFCNPAAGWEKGQVEMNVLMALPPAFDGFIEHSKYVSPACRITFERVPASFADRRVSLHVYPF